LVDSGSKRPKRIWKPFALAMLFGRPHSDTTFGRLRSRFELSYVDQSATSNGTIAAPGLFANATSASSSRPSSSHGLIHTLNPLRVLERPGTPQHDHPTYEGEKYRFAKCKRALPLGVMRKKGIPLPAEELEVRLFLVSPCEICVQALSVRCKQALPQKVIPLPPEELEDAAASL
jgi:hypothetical protein